MTLPHQNYKFKILLFLFPLFIEKFSFGHNQKYSFASALFYKKQSKVQRFLYHLKSISIIFGKILKSVNEFYCSLGLLEYSPYFNDMVDIFLRNPQISKRFEQNWVDNQKSVSIVYNMYGSTKILSNKNDKKKLKTN